MVAGQMGKLEPAGGISDSVDTLVGRRAEALIHFHSPVMGHVGGVQAKIVDIYLAAHSHEQM